MQKEKETKKQRNKDAKKQRNKEIELMSGVTLKYGNKDI